MISDLESRTRDRAHGIPRQPGEPTGIGGADSGASEPGGSGLAGVPTMRGGRGRPTMKDVANRAGVALKTVSRVVNDEPGVTPETATRVRNAINELGFRRNDSARLLRKGQTASIGLILENIGDPFYSALSRAVEDVAHWNGSLLFTGSSDEDPQREQELVLALCARRVDGLIVIPASGDHRYLLPEIAAGVASVFVDRPAGLIDADAVLADNVGGTRAGVSHLIRHGHRRIGFIGDDPRIYTAAQRQQGYRDAMAEAGLPVEPAWVSMAKPTPDSVRDALTAMLAGPAPCHRAVLREQPGHRPGPAGHPGPADGGGGIRRFRARGPGEPRRDGRRAEPGRDGPTGRGTPVRAAGGRPGPGTVRRTRHRADRAWFG